MSVATQALAVRESASVGLEEKHESLILNTPFENIVRSIHSEIQTKAAMEQKKRTEELPKLNLVARILDVYYFLQVEMGMSHREISVEEFLSAEKVLKENKNKWFRRMADFITKCLDFLISGDAFSPVHYALASDLKTHLEYSKKWHHYPPNLAELLGELSNREVQK